MSFQIGKLSFTRGAKGYTRVQPKNVYTRAMEGRDESSDPIEPIHVHVSAPGKVILHGDHSAVYGRLAVAASLGLRTHLVLQEVKNAEQLLSLNFTDIGLKVTYSMKNIQQEIIHGGLPLIPNATNYDFKHPENINQELLLDRIEKYLMVKPPHDAVKKLSAITFLYLYCTLLWPSGVLDSSLNVDVQTELQVCAGMGSSASFIVTIVGSMFSYIKLRYAKSNIPIGDTFDALNVAPSFTESELQLISSWAYYGEKITHGNPSGIDNSTCTFGSIVQFRKGSTPKPLQLHHKLTALLIDTNVPKNTRALVNKVEKLKERLPKIVESTLDSMEVISQSAIGCLQQLSELSLQFGSHLREHQAEFETHYDLLGELVDMNQNMLRVLGVSHMSIDKICTILSSHGLHGKLTGAGGGGYVLAVIPFYAEKELVRKVEEALKAENFSFRTLELGGEGIIAHLN